MLRFCIFTMRELKGWLCCFLQWRIYSLVENVFLRNRRISSFSLSSVNNTSPLLCSSVRIKAFCPNYDRLRLLRKTRQEKSIMGLSFDNILRVFTDNWVISLLIHSSCSVWMQPAREIHFPASCTYEKSWGKTPHALRASRREPCVVPQWLQPGDAGVRPPVRLPGAQHISETMDTASQMLYLGPSTLSLGLTCASSPVGKQAAGACYC